MADNFLSEIEKKLEAETATTKIEEKQKAHGIPSEIEKRQEFVSVEFRVGKGPKKNKVYDLVVKEYSKHGLGLLVTHRDFDLLSTINVGDQLQGMTFFATTAIIKGNGTIKHKTKIEEGEHKGCYILGIESPDIILD